MLSLQGIFFLSSVCLNICVLILTSICDDFFHSQCVQDTLFNPYALSCGHLFCKACACGAASVYIFQGVKSAPPEAKCPVCRAVCEQSYLLPDIILVQSPCCRETYLLFVVSSICDMFSLITFATSPINRQGKYSSCFLLNTKPHSSS